MTMSPLRYTRTVHLRGRHRPSRVYNNHKWNSNALGWPSLQVAYRCMIMSPLRYTRSSARPSRRWPIWPWINFWCITTTTPTTPTTNIPLVRAVGLGLTFCPSCFRYTRSSDRANRRWPTWRARSTSRLKIRSWSRYICIFIYVYIYRERERGQ